MKGAQRVLFASAAVAVLLGCRPADPPTGVEFREVSGDWLYTATEIRSEQSSMVCSIQGLTLTLSKIYGAGAFSGRTSGGVFVCEDGGETFTTPLDTYPVENGYTFDEHIAFDLYLPEWRHDGRLAGETMAGSFQMRNGALRFTGKFRAVRQQR